MKYSKNEINKIIESLIENTKDGNMTWKLGQSCFNSDTSFYMVSGADDESTRFSIDVKLNTDFKPKSSTPFLYIYNDAIIDDRLQVSGYDHKSLEKLKNEVYFKSVYPLIKNNNPDKNIINNILGKIGGKRANRSKRLDEILGEDKSIFDKILGR